MSAQTVAVPIAMRRALAPEDAARADFYALLARLFYAAPDAALLHDMADAQVLPTEGDAALALAWQGLVDASSVMDADAAAEEYEKLFVGVGKAPVPIYAGYYTGAAAVDHPRVRIRADLAALGLAPRGDATEPEDHFAGLFEAMRVLVGGGAGRSPANVAEQRRFFAGHLEAGVAPFFAAIQRAAEANYYRRVAALGAAFAALEVESFHLD